MKCTNALLITFVTAVAATPMGQNIPRDEAALEARQVLPPHCSFQLRCNAESDSPEVGYCTALGYGCSGFGTPTIINGPDGASNSTCTTDCVCTLICA
ncbi:hypothetical protein C8R43DRAFT_982738 [Mycena crocata]|nr:hypothetical protein C8R43DRAFT_982738 [Mycena crocata]